MTQDVDLFVALAGIAGIFVGFGALISVAPGKDIEASQFGLIRGVVTIGLVVMIAALIPVGIGRYGITDHNLWFTCSLIFFSLNLAVVILSLRGPENREIMFAEIRAKPGIALFFWFILEVPVNVPLILTMLGLYPNLEPAFYTTALLFNLFEATFILAYIVYSQMGPSTA